MDQLDPRGATRLFASLRGAACVVSSFFSATLMFALEPMLARMLLPVHGGSPAVWNTCVVVFQVLLVLGYLYAHRLVMSLARGPQIAVHGLLLVASLWFVPPLLQESLVGSTEPAAAIAVALLAGAGLPFFVLATNASLTQQWFLWGRSTDPSWLYAASNAGSLAALIGYPFGFDRWFGLRDQSRLWSYGYVVFVLLTLGILVSGWKVRSHRAGDVVGAAASVPMAPITWARQGDWLFRTAVASSLLLSVTLHISADAGAGPMFWTLPLGLYLLTFVLAFAQKSWVPRRVVVWGVVITVTGCLSASLYPWPPGVRVLLNLLALFFGSWLCHGDVARDRPAPQELTRYFLLIAIGGMLGGLANSIVAPVLFESVAEYPLTLIALSLCVLRRQDLGPAVERARFVRPQTYVAPVAMSLAAAGALVSVHYQRSAALEDPASVFILGAVLLFGVVFLREPGVFQLAVGLVSVFVLTGLADPNPVVLRARSFFSTIKVVDTPEQRSFVHGGVLHGRQYKDPRRRLEFPYHDARGPLAPAMLLFPGPRRIGVVGLGAGALAAVARPDQVVTFYEIDPLVYEVASREFTFLRDSPARLDYVFGDARITLQAAPDGHFDVLMLDAFSGDGVPMHLLTREALETYFRKLRPDGLLVFHISNNYVDLSRVLRGFGQATGTNVLVARYRPGAADSERGATAVDAVATSRSAETLRRLDAIEPWAPLSVSGPAVLWTDDRHDVIGVLDWRRFGFSG